MLCMLCMLCSHMIMLYTVKVTDDFELQVLQNIEGFLNVIVSHFRFWWLIPLQIQVLHSNITSSSNTAAQ